MPARLAARSLRPLSDNPFSLSASKGSDSVDPDLSRAAARSPDGDVKELRVKIDVSYHLKLHALKLLRNKKMSDAIEEALDHYFAHVVQAGADLEDENAQMKKLF